MNQAEYIRMFEVEDTHWWYTSLHALIMQWMPRTARPLRILDAGCGTGRLLQLLSTYGVVEGCDVSATALSMCEKRGLSGVAHADLNTAALVSGRYDLITLIDVLYHRDIKDDAEVLRSMHAALKPGGRLILQVPAYAWLRSSHDDAVHTGRRYTRGQITELMQQCGFTIEKTTYRVALLFLPIALIRLVRNALDGYRAAPVGASDVKEHASVVNALLAAVMKMENHILTHASFPFGTSVFAVARKPTPADDMTRR